jgi:hypothetical protein
MWNVFAGVRGFAVAREKSNAPVGKTPQDVLLAFFAEMYEWERAVVQADKAARRKHQDLDCALWRRRRKAIVSRFCTARKRVYSEPLSFSEQPEYDPATEDITEVVEEKPRRVVVRTQQRAGWKYKRRFAILKKGDRWLIDSWQWSFDGVKWRNGIM